VSAPGEFAVELDKACRLANGGLCGGSFPVNRTWSCNRKFPVEVVDDEVVVAQHGCRQFYRSTGSRGNAFLHQRAGFFYRTEIDLHRSHQQFGRNLRFLRIRISADNRQTQLLRQSFANRHFRVARVNPTAYPGLGAIAHREVNIDNDAIVIECDGNGCRICRHRLRGRERNHEQERQKRWC